MRIRDVVEQFRQHQGPDVATLATWLTGREIIGIDWRGHTWLPMFQFDPVRLTPLTTLAPPFSALIPMFDAWELADWFARPSNWLAGRVPAARVYLMQDAFVLTSEQRRSLQRIFSENRATAVWYYAPGFIDPESGRAGSRTVEELTGFALEPAPQSLPDVVTPVAGAALCRGVTERFGSHQTDLFPRLAIAPGPDVEPIATYDNGQLAIALRENDNWRSVFVGCLYTPPALLRNIARRAGAHIYCSGDTVVSADSAFLALSPTRDGSPMVRLRESALVRDAITGEIVAENRRSFRLPMRKGETRLLVLSE